MRRRSGRAWLLAMVVIGAVGAALWWGVQPEDTAEDAPEGTRDDAPVPRKPEGAGPARELGAPALGRDAGAPQAQRPPPRTDGECRFSNPPASLPMFDGQFTVGDEGAPGRLAGGDPEGQWMVYAVVGMIDSPISERMDLDRSSLIGSAWAEFRDGCFRLVYTSEVRIFQDDGKVMESSMELDWKGAYQVTGDALRIEDSHREGKLRVEQVRFSREGEALTLWLFARLHVGSMILVLEAKPWH